jgi:hypothetical protein
MNELKFTGGARIGTANVTFPFATLKVNKHQLVLNASIVGNLVFQPSNIISIEPYSQMPIVGQGIMIIHNVESYHEKVIFWTFKNPEVLINQIKATGILNNQNEPSSIERDEIIKKQNIGGLPIKKRFAQVATIVWNLLFLIDVIPFFLNGMKGLPIGYGILTALGLLFVSAFLSLVSPGFRKLILKDGRTLEDIKRFSIFIIIISGIMFIGFKLTGGLVN